MNEEKLFTLPDQSWAKLCAHQLGGFRYKWHGDACEFDVVLKGNAEFTVDGRLFKLDEDDVIFIDPGLGHGSLSFVPSSVALVVHVARSALTLDGSRRISFEHEATDANSRMSAPFRLLRRLAARMLLEADEADAPTKELYLRELLHHLRRLPCARVVDNGGADDASADALRRITGYVDEHYASKLSLEEIAAYAQYSRTYLSTFFKNKTGMNLHEYLTRVRFRHALFELTATDKSLTDIAGDNGFSSLDTFNRRFRETYHLLPSEYRRRMSPELVVPTFGTRVFRSPQEPAVREKLIEYLNLSL